jgi:hypothetical protein
LDTSELSVYCVAGSFENTTSNQCVFCPKAYFFLTMMKLCRKTYTLSVPKRYKSCGLAVSEEKFFEVSAHQKQELTDCVSNKTTSGIGSTSASDCSVGLYQYV